MPEKTSNETFESFKVKGEDLLKEIKKLIHEGNIRKILIKDEKGKETYIEIPVTIGVLGTLLVPALAAIGALAAMVGLVTVEVIKEVQRKKPTAPATKKIIKKLPLKKKNTSKKK